jgi:hypothetical protein
MTENDPYKTPRADLEIDAKPVRAAWWKIYFAVYLLLLVISIPGLLLDAQTGVVDWLYLLFLLASLAGLFGFVFTKPILSPPVWLPVLAAVVVADVAYPYLTAIDLSAGMSRDVYIVASAIGWLLSIPNYVALYLYAKPGNPIWKRRAGGAQAAD